VIPILLDQGLANLLASAFYVGKVQAPIVVARRADTHERKIGITNCVGAVQCGAKRPASNGVADQFVDSGFDYRTGAAIDRVYLRRIHVHTDDFVAVSCETTCAHAANVPESEYR